MADDDDFAMDDDDFQDEEQEDQDVDLENRYYNAKAMKEDDPRLALEQFQTVRNTFWVVDLSLFSFVHLYFFVDQTLSLFHDHIIVCFFPL